MTEDEDIAAVDPELLAALRGIRAEAGGVRHDLEELKAKQNEDRRTLRILSGLMLAKLVTLVILFVLMFQVLSLIDRIDDCISADGECAQRNAAATQLIVLSAGKQAELERLTTEVLVGRATGLSPEGLRVREERLAYVQDVLRKVGENLEDVRDGRQPRHQIPTELARPAHGTGEDQ